LKLDIFGRYIVLTMAILTKAIHCTKDVYEKCSSCKCLYM